MYKLLQYGLAKVTSYALKLALTRELLTPTSRYYTEISDRIPGKGPEVRNIELSPGAEQSVATFGNDLRVAET